MGTRFSDDPINQDGANLTVSLEKASNWKEEELPADMEDITLRVYTKYGRDFTADQKMRWKTYGAATRPIPGQRTLNEILAKLSNDEKIKEIIFLEPTKNRKRNTARAIWEQLKGKRAEEILGPERRYMASFWATQEEVKKVLKEVNEIDE